MKDLIIQNLENRLLLDFIKTFDRDLPPVLFAPSNITGEDIFNRWRKTTRYVEKDSYIAALCLRLTQGGYPCYPMADTLEFTGVKSSLKDDEVKDIIFGEWIAGLSLEENLRSLMDETKPSTRLVFA